MKDNQSIYGIRAILEAIDANRPINKLFLQRGLKGELFQELEHKLRKNGISFSYVPVEKLNRLTRNNHQGAIAQISPVPFHDFETLIETVLREHANPLFLLLDQVTDVRNFGAIIRSAECSGVNAIVIAKNGSAPITEDTVKTSAGAVFNIPIAKVDHLKDAIFYLQESAVQVVAATEKAPKNIYEVDFSLPSAILMGSEEKGISPSILQSVKKQAKLPMLGTIGSLNVSVACGVFLYEVIRQRMP